MTYQELAEQLADSLMGDFPMCEIYASLAIDPVDKTDPAATLTIVHEPPQFATYLVLLGDTVGWSWDTEAIDMQLKNATSDPAKTKRVLTALIRRFVAKTEGQPT
ncbi:hypothetical protein [Lacticaseibacillus suihuaensis]